MPLNQATISGLQSNGLALTGYKDSTNLMMQILKNQSSIMSAQQFNTAQTLPGPDLNKSKGSPAVAQSQENTPPALAPSAPIQFSGPIPVLGIYQGGGLLTQAQTIRKTLLGQ